MKLGCLNATLQVPRTLEHVLFLLSERESPIVNFLIKGRFTLLYRVWNKLSKVKNNTVETVRKQI